MQMRDRFTPEAVEVTLRHIENEVGVRAYALDKLDAVVRSIPHLRTALIEVTHERTRPETKQYVAQVTLDADGSVLRAEERGSTPVAAIDMVHDTLERRVQDWKGHVYFERRREAAAGRETTEAEMTRAWPEDRSNLIVRRKSHEIKPLLPEEAIEQMELVGHDFYFFLNSDTDQYNVAYRRKAGGYGLIEPALSGVTETEITQVREK